MYKTIEELPENGISVIKRMLNMGVLEKDKDNNINISDDMLRIFIILDRLGLI